MAVKQKKSTKKNFVLDTNVILHDYECLEKFEENDIYIPITVLEELDKFKKGSEQINHNARAFARFLDSLESESFFTEGAPLGEGRGRLYIKIDGLEHPVVRKAFSERIADHRILSCALTLNTEQKDEPTILVTKDVNLRVKARALGMQAEDYINDKVPTRSLFDAAHEEYTDIPAELIDTIYSRSEGIAVEELDFYSKLQPNQCFILKSDRNSVMVRYNPFSGRVTKVDKVTRSGITPRNAEQAFAFDVITDPNVKLVGLTGKAGTGKTLLALAAALSMRESYQQILLARPIVALANKDLGYLPGDEKQKITPYMQPLFDNLNFIKNQLRAGSAEVRAIEEMQHDNRLIIEALAYIRGRSLSGSLLIVDEAQNLTPHEVKTIITRAGENTKVVLTGDVEQIDSPYLDAESNGLAYMIDKMTGQQLFAHVNLIRGERSELSEIASNLL
ncbi:PhoH family protein [Porphyromonas endodontalis]